MAVVVGDDIQVKLFCKLSPQIGLNIRHFIINGNTGVVPTYQQLADSLSADMAVLYKPLLSSNATYFGLSINRLAGAAWVPEATSTSGQGAGTSTGDALPSQVCGIVRLKSAFAGRANRGRMYLPFPSEADSSGLNVIPVPSLAYQTNALALGLQMVSHTVTNVVPTFTVSLGGLIYHRVTNTFTVLSTRIVPLKWATQRRRGAYGASNADPF